MTVKILSTVCADELAESNEVGGESQATPDEQAERARQLGFKRVAVRFFWFNGKRINVTALNAAQLEEVDNAFRSRGIEVLTIASPIGKCWLSSEGGPGHAKYMTKREVCDQIDGAINVAKVLGARMVRVFSGYPKVWLGPASSDESVSRESVELLKLIGAKLGGADLIGVVENEKYLEGWDAGSLLNLLDEVAHDNLFIALDAGNLQHCGFDQVGICAQVRRVMNSGQLASLHLKECAGLPPNVDDLDFTEAMLAPFHVPAGTGSAGFRRIFETVASCQGQNQRPIEAMIEGHLKSGGAFHGSSGVEGVKRIQASMAKVWDGLDIQVI